MALANYITSADITHVHLKQFPEEILQPYVDEANDQLEDIGLQKGVSASEIDTPVSIVIKRYLSNYVVMRFAQDSIGTNNVEISDEDMYKRMAEEFQIISEGLKAQITPELLRGVSENNPSSRSVSTCRIHRTA
jgi:hypothetical protein